MPLNESKGRPRRERYPLEFDLEGMPRDRAARDLALRNLTTIQEFDSMSQNSFSTDKASNVSTANLTEVQKAQLLDELLRTTPVGREIDLSKPIVVPYNPRDPRNQFPCMVYHHDSGHVLILQDEKQLKTALKRGFKAEPSPNHDYSKLRNGVAAKKEAAAPREEELSADDLAELDAADEAAS